MADIFEAHASNKDWFEKEQKRVYALSNEGRAKSLMDTFSIDFTTLVRHPKYIYTDDGRTHYLDSSNTHYYFDRSNQTWGRIISQ